MDRYDTLLSKFEQGVAKEAFHLLDKDNSGELNLSEVEDALKFLHPNLRGSDIFRKVKEVFEKVDDDGSRSISYKEFQDIVNVWKLESTTFDEYL